MLIINTTTDLASADQTEERTAFLQALLNDYITFDDAVYPDGYDTTLQPGDAGYIAPVIRQEWNAGAAAQWGFADRAAVEYALTLVPPATASLGDEWTHPESGEVLVYGESGWEPQVTDTYEPSEVTV